jgi:FkbM family methyltransferase
MRDSLTKLFGNHLVNLDMLPDDAVVIDAGACVGNFIKDIHEHVKQPFIFAIEPSKGNIPNLMELSELRLTHAGLLLITEAALVGQKEPNEMEFREIKDRPEWGNVNGLYSNRGYNSYMVETINLKDLLYTIPLKTIHYLKMDIENSEWDVVNDMNEDTAKRIQQISMEIHGHQIKITKKLEDLGYKTLFEKGELYAVKKES